MSKVDWNSVKKEVPEWFRDAKFGLFFHWGPYSVPAYQDEWYSRRMYEKGNPCYRHHEETFGSVHDFGYKDFYPMMKGEKFDPGEWAALAVRSGAKYAGPVSEHADNFAMWDSRVNPVNSVNFGPGRDVLGECFEAFRKEGLRTLATFHHQWLWGWFMSSDVEADVYLPGNEKYYGPIVPLEANRANPHCGPDRKFCENWKEKVYEVIDKYDPDVVYFDSRAVIIDEDIRFSIPDYFYNTKGKKDGVITYKWEDYPKGTGVFDIECGRFTEPQPFPWQVDDRLEDHPTTWSMVENPKYRSSGRIIRQLCDIVSKNGNLLLNVGPYADGSFHPDAVRILNEVGEWLALNGEAIYGTTPFTIAAEGRTAAGEGNYDAGKLGQQVDLGRAIDRSGSDPSEGEFRFTVKNDALYVIAMGWPEDGTFHIRALGNSGVYERPVEAVTMPGCPDSLAFTRDAEGLHVTAPDRRPCKSAYVLKING